MLKKSSKYYSLKKKIKESTYKMVGNGWASGGSHGDEGVKLGGRQVEDCAASGQAYTAAQPASQGPYTESFDLCFEPFFAKKDEARNWMIARDYKTADQHCYKFLLAQHNKFL